MKHLDLLLLDRAGGVTERIFDDLGLASLARTVFAGEESSYKVLCSVLRYPIADAATLRERQDILRDFETYPSLADNIIRYCDRTAEWRLNVKQGVAPEYRLRQYLLHLLPLLDMVIEFPRHIVGRAYRSATLSSFREVPGAMELRKEAEALLQMVPVGSREPEAGRHFRLTVESGEGYKLKTARLAASTASPVVQYYDKKAKQAITICEEYVAFSEDYILENNVTEIRRATILNLCSQISAIHAAALSFFTELRVAASFYRAALKLKDHMTMKGLALCMPTVRDDRRDGICATGVYDLGLAVESAHTVVASDVDTSNGNILLVTGMNHGGKTTFLRGVGIAQLLAQSGLFVPAETYVCPAFSGILTHFPTEEDDDLAYGKLAEELTRLRADFHILRGGGLALFNESFSTTTTHEGAAIGAEVLRAAGEGGSVCVFVTHLVELAAAREKLPGAVSLVTERNAHGERTYRIVPGEPLTERYTAGLL